MFRGLYDCIIIIRMIKVEDDPMISESQCIGDRFYCFAVEQDSSKTPECTAAAYIAKLG